MACSCFDIYVGNCTFAIVSYLHNVMMKKIKIISAFILLCACLVGGLSACYDEKADIAFFSGEQLIDQIGTCTNFVSHVTLYLNGKKEKNVGIAYGKGFYQAVSSDVKVVKVGVKNDRLILTAGGSEGNAVVTVTDDKGNQAQLTVEVLTEQVHYETETVEDIQN